jgi:type VI secretion system protein ImpM
VLLAALAAEASYETVTAAVGRLPLPAASGPPPGGTQRLPRGPVLIDGAADTLAAGFAAARQADHARAYGAASYWWTIGGEGFAPVGLMERRMPDPYIFGDMLTGRFAAAPAMPVVG